MQLVRFAPIRFYPSPANASTVGGAPPAGHADGHRALLRDGILVAGDTLMQSITPNVGLYPDSRPDPLGDYLRPLERIAS